MFLNNFQSISMQVESPSVDMVVDVIQDQKHSYERYNLIFCKLFILFIIILFYC